MLCFAEPTLLFSLFILILTKELFWLTSISPKGVSRGSVELEWMNVSQPCLSSVCVGLLAHCGLITVTHHAYLQGVLRVLGLGITIIQYSLLWIQLTCSLRMPQKNHLMSYSIHVPTNECATESCRLLNQTQSLLTVTLAQSHAGRTNQHWL